MHESYTSYEQPDAKTTAEGPPCTSAFRSSSAAFGLVVLSIWATFLALVPPDVCGAGEEAAATATEEAGAVVDGERTRLLTQHHAHRTDGSRLGGVGQYHSLSHKNVVL